MFTFFYSAYNFILNELGLSRLVPKAFEFVERSSKPEILAMAGFQKWWVLGFQLFKENCSLGTYLVACKTGVIGPSQCSATPKNLLSNRSKRFELAGFQKHCANKKAFST
jgi:hypothetical protein